MLIHSKFKIFALFIISLIAISFAAIFPSRVLAGKTDGESVGQPDIFDPDTGTSSDDNTYNDWSTGTSVGDSGSGINNTGSSGNWSDVGTNTGQTDPGTYNSWSNNNNSGNPGEFQNPIPDVTNVQGLVGKISKWLTGIVAGIAVIMIMVGGLMYVIHSGNAAEAQKSKNYIKYSVTGLALVLGANLIITEINYLLGNGNAVSEFSSFIGRLIDWLIVIIAGLAVIFLMYAGYTYITGGEKGATQAEDMIKYTIIGLIVALLSYALVNWIVLTFAT